MQLFAVTKQCGIEARRTTSRLIKHKKPSSLGLPTTHSKLQFHIFLGEKVLQMLTRLNHIFVPTQVYHCILNMYCKSVFIWEVLIFTTIREYGLTRNQEVRLFSDTFCNKHVLRCTKRVVANSYPRKCVNEVPFRENLLTQNICHLQ